MATFHLTSLCFIENLLIIGLRAILLNIQIINIKEILADVRFELNLQNLNVNLDSCAIKYLKYIS